MDGEVPEGGGLTGDLADRRRPADRDGTPGGLDLTLAAPGGLDLTPVALDLTPVDPEGLAEGAIASTTVSVE